MKHPVYFYCMLAVCCVFVGSKFLTRASEGQGGSLYPHIQTPQEEYDANIKAATDASLESYKKETTQVPGLHDRTIPTPSAPPLEPTTQANTAAYPQTSAQQYPTSHAQATAQPTQAAAQAATAAQPYFWQYYWQMVVTKATALQNYLAKQLAALRTRFGL